MSDLPEIARTLDFMGDAPEADPPAPPERIGRYRIERLLGRGGFGLVYLARDDQLARPVAIKVPHASLIARREDAEAYLLEARTVANLDHANIVPVHDVGSTDEFPCYIVSKFVDGTDLARRLKTMRPAFEEAAELVATVAEALHYAHKQGLVHRDIKPGNILLDKSGKPFVVDFGLALRERDVGKGPCYVGTTAYMSPEQARGEGHRVDARSDIFSLGVVLYEMLTGRRPFQGDSKQELLEKIATLDVRPPRQWDDSIPKELERLALKSLSKRAAERYTTAKDLAEDIRCWLPQSSGGERGAAKARTEGANKTPSHTPAEAGTPAPASNSSANTKRSSSTPAEAQPAPSSGSHVLRVIPKGLRSFDADDADFFLELLAGPRDRGGMPDSIRFWKLKIECSDPDNTFAVGLIYGPSGCGKSSLVKAGLLPRLAPSVNAVYVEASANETEGRLLRSLRRRLPLGNWAGLNEQHDLAEVLSALRLGHGLAGDKLLVVIDQFEQWLHAHGGERDTLLVRALRQCDGGRVQCVALVRDDFWLAVSRFMQELEIRLVEGENSRLVDLFDCRHARKVLAAMGHAFGALPETNRSGEQDAFLDQAVAGLTQEGKVVPVRLSLFAEMVKSKPWTPAALREIGGAEGVGVAFLEETFSSPSAPPQHRLHQKTAQAVLAALLPDAGTDIKGHMRSREELLDASGCKSSPRQFEEVMALLDRELRLVTPADSESLESDESGPLAPGERVRVRASPPAPLPKGEGKRYQLTHDYLVPSLRTWLTRKQKATRRGRAELRLVDLASLWAAKPENRRLPSLLEFMQIRWNTSAKAWTPGQRKMMRSAARIYGLRTLLSVVALAAIAIASIGPVGNYLDRPKQLYKMVYRVRLDEVPAALDEIDKAGYRSRLMPMFRQDLDDAEKSGDVSRGLRPSLALLRGDESQRDSLYSRLIAAPREEADTIRSELLKREQNLPTSVLEGEIDAPMRESTNDPKNKVIAERKKNVAIALLRVGLAEKVWPLFRRSKDESVRSYLIQRCSQFGVDSKVFFQRWAVETDAGARSALLLLLGEYPDAALPPDERRQLVGQLATLFESEPDPGLHSAAQWLLHKWKREDDLTAAVKRLEKNEPERLADGEYDKRHWYVNAQGQTYAIIDADQPFTMGSSASEHGPDVTIEPEHLRNIGRRYAIAAAPVTIEAFSRYRAGGPQHATLPVTGVTWYEAAGYCNWLSGKDGIEEDQWCYKHNAADKYAEGTLVKDGFLKLTGYRLPTEAEWEFACRAGTTTQYYFGQSDGLLADYAWYRANSNGGTLPAASRKPNDFGLFDMLGNVWQWCEYPSLDYPPPNSIVAPDNGIGGLVTNSRPAAMRGGAYNNLPDHLRCAYRGRMPPNSYQSYIGFRPARTIKRQVQ